MISIFIVNFICKIMTCIYILHQLSWGHNQTPKVASNMQRNVYCCSFIPCKNQKELLTPGEIFNISRYECFMESKNMIKTYCSCKPSKTTLNFIKILLFFVKKIVEALDELQDTQNVKKVKKANKLWLKSSNQ